MILDGEKINEEGHDYLIEKLNLPVYYGKNLDALFDCLTSMKIDIEIKNSDVMDKDLLDTFKDAYEENDLMSLKII